MGDELLPCPFCGRVPKLTDRARTENEKALRSAGDRIYFAACFGEGYSAHAHHVADSPEALAVEWNRRPVDATERQRREAAERENERLRGLIRREREETQHYAGRAESAEREREELRTIRNRVIDERDVNAARAMSAERELRAARNALADLLSERRGSEVTEAQDEETAMERIARRLASNESAERRLAALCEAVESATACRTDVGCGCTGMWQLREALFAARNPIAASVNAALAAAREPGRE